MIKPQTIKVLSDKIEASIFWQMKQAQRAMSAQFYSSLWSGVELKSQTVEQAKDIPFPREEHGMGDLESGWKSWL